MLDHREAEALNAQAEAAKKAGMTDSRFAEPVAPLREDFPVLEVIQRQLLPLCMHADVHLLPGWYPGHPPCLQRQMAAFCEQNGSVLLCSMTQQFTEGPLPGCPAPAEMHCKVFRHVCNHPCLHPCQVTM